MHSIHISFETVLLGSDVSIKRNDLLSFPLFQKEWNCELKFSK